MTAPPRTDKTCSSPVSVPLSEGFVPQTTITMFSLPFHAPEGTTVNVDLEASLNDPNGNPDLRKSRLAYVNAALCQIQTSLARLSAQ